MCDGLKRREEDFTHLSLLLLMTILSEKNGIQKKDSIRFVCIFVFAACEILLNCLRLNIIITI
jgi:hypothetical protein